jgi:predicted deacylase
VYLLVAPQVHLVSGADGVIASQTSFAKVNTNLAARIAAAKAAGKDTTAAQADLDAMNAAVTKAVGLATPLPATLLPLTPAQYNAGTAGPILTSARTALAQARDLLKSAVQDAKACRAALA